MIRPYTRGGKTTYLVRSKRRVLGRHRSYKAALAQSRAIHLGARDLADPTSFSFGYNRPHKKTRASRSR